MNTGNGNSLSAVYLDPGHRWARKAYSTYGRCASMAIGGRIGSFIGNSSISGGMAGLSYSRIGRNPSIGVRCLINSRSTNFGHTHINFVIESGVSVKEAQILARHAIPELTMNVYGRVREERLSEAVE